MREPTPQPGGNPYPSDQRRKQMPEDRFKVASADLLGDVMAASKKGVSLDGPEVSEVHTRAMGHYLRELDAHAKARRMMDRDEAFYDGDQWEPEDIQRIKDRGQEPMVFNVIATSINWVLGTERRGRTDFRILPRRKTGAKAAEMKTKLMKYVSDCNSSEFHVSRAFADAVKAGVGWLESGVQHDDEGEPVYDRREDWRNLIYDSAATELDLNDGRFMFRTKWVDKDVALGVFPDRAETIKAACYTAQDYGASLDRAGDDAMDSMEDSRSMIGSHHDHPLAARDRFRMIEAWLRIPVMADKIAGGEFAGDLFDPSSPGHMEQIATGQARVVRRPTFRMFVMICTTNGVLDFRASPYRHNRFPFTPIWAYRKSSDGMPYGIIRAMVDAQRDINKRFSKAQYILNSQKVIMDEGAVEDLDEFEEEIARPDSIIVKKPNKHLQIDVDRDLSDAHLSMMSLSTGMIQSLSGITDESLGRTTNANSGKAIIARQEQGSLATAPIFDNLRMARQYHGEKMLSLIEQFYTDAKQFRITDQRRNAEHLSINDGLPENDITRTKADFLISEQDWNATIRQAQTQEFMELLSQLAPGAPQLVMVMLDLLVEGMDIPNRDELVKRIRALTGAEDPDADPNNPDPEKIARDEAKAAAAAMEQRAAEANILTMEGKAAEAQAKAQKIKAEVNKLRGGMPADRLTQQKTALELALMMLGATPAVDTADALLEAAGAKAPGIPAPAGPAAAPVPPQPVPQPPMPQGGMGLPPEA